MVNSSFNICYVVDWVHFLSSVTHHSYFLGFENEFSVISNVLSKLSKTFFWRFRVSYSVTFPWKEIWCWSLIFITSPRRCEQQQLWQWFLASHSVSHAWSQEVSPYQPGMFLQRGSRGGAEVTADHEGFAAEECRVYQPRGDQPGSSGLHCTSQS